MVTGKDEVDEDRRRAEVFDALSHPTRIMILKALSGGSMGFADLKKKLGIESSGHLQHHLNKLSSLTKTDDYGKYTLSDQGKDALLSVETVERVVESGAKQNEKARSAKKNIALKSAVVALALLLVISSVLAVFEHNKASSFQNTIGERDIQINQLNDIINGRDTLITQLDTAANWAQLVLNMKPPLGSQYLTTLPSPNHEENQTKIFVMSTAAGYHYGPPLPFPFNNTPWFSGNTGGYFSSRRVLELTDNRSVAVSFWGWSLGGGGYQLDYRGGDPYLMIGVTVRNDYTPADAGNGTDPSAPIGKLMPGSYGSIINLTATLYSENGSIIQAAEANGIQSPTARGGYEFLLGSDQTKQVVFYLSPSSLDIDHYEIYVSYLSANPQP